MGDNINGPAIIHMPDWAAGKLGTYQHLSPVFFRSQGDLHSAFLCRCADRSLDHAYAQGAGPARVPVRTRRSAGAARMRAPGMSEEDGRRLSPCPHRLTRCACGSRRTDNPDVLSRSPGQWRPTHPVGGFIRRPGLHGTRTAARPARHISGHSNMAAISTPLPGAVICGGPPLGKALFSKVPKSSVQCQRRHRRRLPSWRDTPRRQRSAHLPYPHGGPAGTYPAHLA